MDKGIEILAIDDDPLMIRFLEKALSKLGVGFYASNQAQSGVETFREKSETVTIVLLDLSLSDQPWTKTVDQLLEIRKDVKIVISSGSIVEDQTYFVDKRIFAQLPKPFSIPELQKLIESTI